MSVMTVQEATTAMTSLDERLKALHQRLVESVPGVDRVSLALYDHGDDSLRTFIDSTLAGSSLHAYQYRLADCESLSMLARSRQPRLLVGIPDQLAPSTQHSAYVLQEGYLASYTIPLNDGDRLVGFLFFDSRQADTFSAPVRRELEVYANLILMVSLHELASVHTVVSAVQIARHFSEVRDVETGAHLERMSRYARLIATGVAPGRGHSDEWIERLFIYAPLHDIGKIGIPDQVLLKPGRLDPDEWETMKSHTTIGARIVENIVSELGVTTPSDEVMMRRIVELHHETLDGTGYPYGLSGDEVPDEARIVTVADIYDALSTKRPYKPAWEPERVADHLVALAEDHKIDRECVDALLSAEDERAAIADSFPEEQPAT
jgi:HD-GYP domain-containing protein (c-di-GMP phosphodiesterase class II)